MLIGSSDVCTKVELSESSDFTGMLKLVRIAGTGTSSVVYHCSYARDTEVAVKAFTIPPGCDTTEKCVLIKKVRHGIEMWKRLEHRNIVPFLGMTCDKDFGSDSPCIVSMWMKNGTLNEYIKHGVKLSIYDRIQLITGSVAGLEYLHSRGVVHGNLHPGNILIDGDYNPRLADFSCSLSISPMQDQVSYLWADSVHPERSMWAAPELLYPDLYPNLEVSEATLNTDIYSLGSIIFFILSGYYPWRDRAEAENSLREFQNPPRPLWPVNMPDGVWSFIGQCWSPQEPGNRPSAQEALIFSTNRLEEFLLPNPMSDINVVLFGALGSGKSSIINLLAGQEIAHISSGADPCTKRPRWYQVSIGDRKIRFWDTMGFFLAHDGPTSPLSPYEQAQSLLRSLPEGVNLILLCAQKGVLAPSVGRLYWLINDFFCAGRAPIALIITHFDTPDDEWWEHNKRDIARRARIPIHAIPHLCTTTDLTESDQSKHALTELLQTYAASFPPTPARLNFSSYTAASSDLTAHCRITTAEAVMLVEKFKKPPRTFNVVFFGEPGAGVSSIIHLINGHPAVDTSSGPRFPPRSHRVHTGLRQFCIWEVVNEAPVNHEVYTKTVKNICQHIRDSCGEAGVDLLVLCKRSGQLTTEELNGYRLYQETLCRGKCRVAIILTQFESQDRMEQWWDANDKILVKAVGGNVICHTYMPPLDAIESGKTLVDARLSIEVLLEDCVSSRTTSLLPRRRMTNVEKLITGPS